MRERCALLVVVCHMVAACSTSPGVRTQSGRSTMSYVDRDHGVWLAPQLREHAMCRGSQMLICNQGIGRMSLMWCECESLLDQNGSNASLF